MLLVCGRVQTNSLIDELNGYGHVWKQVDEPDDLDGTLIEQTWQSTLVIGSDVASTRIWSARLKDVRTGPVIGIFDEVPTRPDALEEFQDFLVVPFHKDELALRIGRVLQSDTVSALQYGPVRMDPDRYQVYLRDRCLDLTYMEFELLKYFVTNADIVLSRETLLRHVWGYEYFGGGRTVDVHVRRLRAKFGQEHAHLIATVRSVGYQFGTRNI